MSGFIPVRRGLLEHIRDQRMGVWEFFVYGCLHFYADYETGVAVACAPKIARRPKEVDKVRKALGTLKKKGYINYKDSRGKLGSYRILINKFEPTFGIHSGKRLNAFAHNSLDQPIYEPIEVKSKSDGSLLDVVSPQYKNKEVKNKKNSSSTTNEKNMFEDQNVSPEYDNSLPLSKTKQNKQKNNEPKPPKEFKQLDQQLIDQAEKIKKTNIDPEPTVSPLEIEHFENVKHVIETWNGLDGVKQYNTPIANFSSGALRSQLFTAIHEFVKTPKWKATWDTILEEYKQSDFLREGKSYGGQTNSLTWIFKDKQENVDKIISGFYRDKKTTNNQYFADAKNVNADGSMKQEDYEEIITNAKSSGWKVANQAG